MSVIIGCGFWTDWALDSHGNHDPVKLATAFSICRAVAVVNVEDGIAFFGVDQERVWLEWGLIRRQRSRVERAFSSNGADL